MTRRKKRPTKLAICRKAIRLRRGRRAQTKRPLTPGSRPSAAAQPQAAAPPESRRRRAAEGAAEAVDAGAEEAAEPATEPQTAAEASAEPESKEAAASPEDAEAIEMDWYILKVQSNREDSIREGLSAGWRLPGWTAIFGDVIVPTEKVTEFKGGKKRVTKRKLYPGYLVVQMEINEDTWFLVRETPGIGDFTGAAGTPTPMLPHEVARILAKQEEKTDEAPKLKIAFSPGDRVKINEGTFENFEGEVDTIDEQNGRVTVMINIFGRSTPVELEYWQIEIGIDMAKKLVDTVKFQVPGGQATPAPPVGTALGRFGINLGQFVQQFNERTKDQRACGSRSSCGSTTTARSSW